MKKVIFHSKPWISKEDRVAVERTLNSYIAKGAFVDKFEKGFSSYIGAKEAVAVGSCRRALSLILGNYIDGKKNEVLIPSYVCPSVMYAVINAGGKPVPCDCGSDSWNVSFEEFKKKINKKTAAIIAVHIFGIPCDVVSLKKLEIPIIEDCAQALGSRIGEKIAGSFGDAAVFSFHATKCTKPARDE